jgi:hypothetical protein
MVIFLLVSSTDDSAVHAFGSDDLADLQVVARLLDGDAVAVEVGVAEPVPCRCAHADVRILAVVLALLQVMHDVSLLDQPSSWAV